MCFFFAFYKIIRHTMIYSKLKYMVLIWFDFFRFLVDFDNKTLAIRTQLVANQVVRSVQSTNWLTKTEKNNQKSCAAKLSMFEILSFIFSIKKKKHWIDFHQPKASETEVMNEYRARRIRFVWKLCLNLAIFDRVARWSNKNKQK